MTSALLVLTMAASVSSPTVERSVQVQGPGRTTVALDAGVYDAARKDLADLRVVDDRGGAVPYVLDRGVAEGGQRAIPRIVDRGFRRGTSEVATLDFGLRLWKREVTLDLSGDNFRRRVVVEGSDDAQHWETLTDGAYVFAVPGAPAARYPTVGFPENEQRYLRVTVHRGEGDPDRIDIRGAEARTSGRREAPSVPLTPVLGREEDPKRHETLLVLDLAARNRPFRSIALDVADPHFMRGIVVEARLDPPAPKLGEIAQPFAWTTVGEGCVYRYDEGGRRIESQRLDVGGRESVIRLRVRNRDDRPLDIRGVAITGPVERVLFEAVEGRRYRLTYGSPELGPPSYDLARTIGDLEAWSASALAASLGPVERRAQASARPWTERHPGLLWSGLFAAVAILGMITWRALAKSG